MPAGSPIRTRTPIAPLTGVRGFAALWVVLCHFRDDLALALPGWDMLDAIAFHGYLGVDLFAFLSGFVISFTYGDRLAALRGEPTRRFLWLRLARIYPLHLFMLFLFVVSFGLSEGANALARAVTDPTFLRQVLLLHGWGFDDTFSWNVPSWTVSSEWFCYLLFPLFAPGLSRLNSGPLAGGLAALCLAATTGVLFAVGHPRFTAYLDWGLVRIGGEFLTGCLLYRAWKVKLGADRPWGWIGLVALVFAILASTSQPALAVPAFAITVYALAWDERPLGLLFGNRVSVYLGEISYSIYLVHWFVLQHVGMLGLDRLPDGIRVWAMFGVVIAASAATYHGVENKARSWLRHQLS